MIWLLATALILSPTTYLPHLRQPQQSLHCSLNRPNICLHIAVPSAWKVLPPDIHMASSFISFSTLLRCQFIIDTFLAMLFEIAPYSLFSALPQSLFFILCFSSIVFITSWYFLFIIFSPSRLVPWWWGLYFGHCCIPSNRDYYLWHEMFVECMNCFFLHQIHCYLADVCF